MVFVDSGAVGVSPLEMRERLRDHGVLVTLVGGKVRMVTHLDVSAQDIETAIDAWRRATAT